MNGTEDRPINTSTDDLFSMNDKFVEPVCHYIGNNSEGAVTIAVSGEWGSGKSSAINLLKERLKGYELLLMSDLPTDGEPVAGKIYLAMVDERLKYIVKTPIGDKVEGYLDIKIFGLTTEVLNPHKAAILTELSKKGHIRSMEKAPHNGRNIIVNFDPFLEQKLEVPQLVVSFLRELENAVDNRSIKIDLHAIFGTLVELGLDITSVKYPWATKLKKITNNILCFFKELTSRDNMTFSEKAQRISKKIAEAGYRFFVFIDEMDRLTSDDIVKFLSFCRVLDSFTGLVCIVGFDYKRVLDKLANEPGTCFRDLRGAQDYLDKFFQPKYQILHSTEEKIEYANRVVEEAGLSSVFSIFRQDDRSKVLFKDIISYLSTPRMIKKFVMTVQSKQAFLESSKSFVSRYVFQFIAATIKSPIILDVFPEKILSKYEESQSTTKLIKQLFKKEETGVLQKNETDCIVLDEKTYDFALDSANITPTILFLYVSGYEDHEIIKTIRNLIIGNSDERNDILKKLTLPENDHLFQFVSNHLGWQDDSKKPPDINVLNNLFEKKIQSPIVNWRPISTHIITYFLKLIPIDTVISKGSLVLSSLYIDLILSTYDFENALTALSDLDKRIEKAGQEKFLEHFRLYGMDKVQFKGENIASCGSSVAVRDMMEMWLEKEAKHGHRKDTEYKYLSAKAEKYRDMLKEKVHAHQILNDNNAAEIVKKF